MNNKKYIRFGLITAGLWSLFMAIGCGGGEKESTPSVPTPTDMVEKAFELAKSFPSDASKITEIQKIVNRFKSEPERQKALLAKRDGETTFTNLIAAGKASPASAEVMETVLGWDENARAQQLHGTRNNKNTWAILQSERPQGESRPELCLLIAKALPYEADEINKFKKGDNFDADLVSCILGALPAGDKAELVVTALSDESYKIWADWVEKNLNAAVPAYERLYKYGQPERQNDMRSKALAAAYAGKKDGVMNFLNKLSDLGLAAKLKDDEYKLGDATGKLLQVLVKRIHDDKANPGAIPQDDIRDISAVIKGLLGGADYTALATTTPFAGKTLVALLGGGVDAKILLNLEDFNLAELLAVINAKPVDENKVNIVFNGVIAKPALRASLATSEFLVKLASLKATDATVNIITKLFAELTKAQADQALKTKAPAPNNKTALQILADSARAVADEDLAKRQAMLAQVIKASPVADIGAALPVVGPATAKSAADYAVMLKAVGPEQLDSLKKLFDAANSTETANELTKFAVEHSNPVVQQAFRESYATAVDGKDLDLRSGLLAAAYGLADPAKKLAAITGLVADPGWGLKAGIATNADDYNSLSGGPAGKLLFVLTQRAIQDARAPGLAQDAINAIYDGLHKYALAIKAAVTEPQYAAMVGTVIAANTPLNILNAALGNAKTGYANYYLAHDELLGLLNATAAAVTSADLKKLYTMVIGDDAAAAVKLLGEGAQNQKYVKTEMGTNDIKFIHFLVARREVDADVNAILTDFLNKVARVDPANKLKAVNALTGGAIVSNALSALLAKGGAPNPQIQALRDAMRDALLAADTTGETALALTSAQLRELVRVDFGQAGAAGQEHFKKVYAALLAAHAAEPAGPQQAANRATIDGKLLAMRSELLTLAYGADDAQRAARMNKFFGKASDAAAPVDDWGLFAGMLDDTYRLPRLAAGPYEGRLLRVLVRRAVAEKNAADVAGGGVTPLATAPSYQALKSYAQAIKTIMGTEDKYIAHAITAPVQPGNPATFSPGNVQAVSAATTAAKAPVANDSALGRFRTATSANAVPIAFRAHGFAEETLGVLHNNIEGIDAALVFNAGFEAAVDNALLRKLFGVVVIDQPAAGEIAGRITGAIAVAPGLTPVARGDAFIALLAKRGMDAAGDNTWILNDYLTKLATAPGNPAQASALAISPDAAGVRPLGYVASLAPFPRVAAGSKIGADADVEASRNDFFAVLVKHTTVDADLDTVMAVPNAAGISLVLNAIKDSSIGDDAMLARAIAAIPNDPAKMRAVAEFLNTLPLADAKALYTLERDKVPGLGVVRDANGQLRLRDAMVRAAFREGQKTSWQAALNEVTQLITNDFFTGAQLAAADYDVFGTNPSTLLYAVLAQVRTGTMLTQPLVNGIATALKAKFTGNWQNYIGVTPGIGGGVPVDQFVAANGAGDLATARAWLAY